MPHKPPSDATPSPGEPHADAGSALERYRAKRTSDGTPEPFGGGAVRPGLFVVQLHAARQRHFDLRLELDGVLKSWAVPKGPSLDPEEMRFAVATEDHPAEYGDFEGVIPAGNYGAGSMIVWDRGSWLPLDDPREGLEKGKLLFELRGYKLRGVWTLFRMNRRGADPKEWMLMKKPDGWAGGEPPGDESVLSGLTVEELARGESRAREVLAEIDGLAEELVPAAGGPPLAAGDVELMLAETERRPFSRPGWLFELKYDGYRMLAERQGARAELYFRRGGTATAAFPELARALKALPYEHLIADGEAVVLEEDGRPSFQRLGRRAKLTRRFDIERAAVADPATLFLFDLLAFGGRDLRRLPLWQRKRLLARLLPQRGPVRYCDHVEEQGEALYRAVAERRLEGLIAKRADAPYRGGRSSDWLKLPVERRGDFAVVGFTAPKGSRSGFGALHLAGRAPQVAAGESARDDGGLVYVGRVGTGFDGALLDEIAARLEPLVRDRPACEPSHGGAPLPSGGEHSWVEPRLVAQVRFKSWTEEGLFRQPVFERLRDDKAEDPEAIDPEAIDPEAIDPEAIDPEAIDWAPASPGSDEPRPEGDRVADKPPPEPADAGAGAVSARRGSSGSRLELSNLDKLFWPQEGFTKGDLLGHYQAIAPWALPYLADRPLVLDRYPDGIDGKSFFQKEAPDYVPDWVRTEPVYSESGGEEIDHFICDDLESLLYVINLGSIPLHLFSSRIADLARPDWAILDLDPKEAPFSSVIAVALEGRRLCRAIGLPVHVKTSGGSGLHLLVPLGGRATHQQARLLAELLARVLAARLSEIATTARPLASRGGKVYLDFLQNGLGKLLVAPFCVRPFPGAPVSMPLAWDEVGDGLDPRNFHLANAAERMEKLGDDPLAPVLSESPDLPAALKRLAEVVEEEL